MDTPDLQAQLGEYKQQLALLQQDDIRVPNQSLILDYFCTDHELTEFLRNEVFLESSKRHNIWKKVNQRSTHDIRIKTDNEVSRLLDSGNSHVSRVWADIVRLTANQQSHDNIAEYIVIHSSNKLTPVLDPEHQEIARYNVWSLPLVDKANVNNNPSVTQSTRKSQNTVVRTAAPVSKSVNKKPLSPVLVATLLLLGVPFVGIYFDLPSHISSTTQSSESSTQASQSSESSTQASTDKSDLTMELNRLEIEQKEAILICEHKPIIKKIKSLDLIEPGNIARRDALIASSNKQIAFLDQKSAENHTYWEDPSCTHGIQWFDDNADGQYRLFLAVSRKCPNPTVNYVHTNDKEGNEILSQGKYNAYGHSVGEIRIPYGPDGSYAFVKRVTCPTATTR